MKNYKLTGVFMHKKALFGMVLYVQVVYLDEVYTPNGLMQLSNKILKKADEMDAAKLLMMSR